VLGTGGLMIRHQHLQADAHCAAAAVQHSAVVADFSQIIWATDAGSFDNGRRSTRPPAPALVR
jgi:hypothetical protein